MKRWSILVALLLCLFFSTAGAEVRTRQTDAAIANGGAIITTFDTELPNDLAAALQAHGYAAESLCGVDWRSASRFAWIVQRQENGRGVIALSKWPSGDWQAVSLGARLLPAEGDFTLDCDGWGASMLLQAPLSDGGTERFAFEPSGSMAKVFWRLQEYRASHPDGSGERVYCEDVPSTEEGFQQSYVFEATDAVGGVRRADGCWRTSGLANEIDYASFPRTEEQFKAVSVAP